MSEIAIAVYGIGGFGREVMPIAEVAAQKDYADRNADLYFVETAPTCAEVNGFPVISEVEFLALEAEKMFAIAISDSSVRQVIHDRLLKLGANPIHLSADGVHVYHSCELGEGAIICANAVITSNVRIGRSFHMNLGSYVAHDCVIGDFVTFAPHVACNGNVQIDSHAYIGTGAVIKQGTSERPLIIGEGATIGMGAVVTKSVEPFTTVIGNPARLLTKP